MYKIGDYVVYRQLSVCVVETVETPPFERDKTKLYYRLSPVFDNVNDTVIYVPQHSQECMRAVARADEMNAALRALPHIKVTVFAAKKTPQLTAHYQDVLASCDILQYLTLLKEVSLKEKTGAKKLSEIDIRFRNKTERLVCEEFAVVLGQTPNEIKTIIYKLIG